MAQRYSGSEVFNKANDVTKIQLNEFVRQINLLAFLNSYTIQLEHIINHIIFGPKSITQNAVRYKSWSQTPQSKNKRQETIKFRKDMSFTIKPINAFLTKDMDILLEFQRKYFQKIFYLTKQLYKQSPFKSRQTDNIGQIKIFSGKLSKVFPKVRYQIFQPCTITKMDPYVYLTIGSRKYKSKSHTSGGKTPFWVDTFEVPVIMSPSQLQMKVQLYDKDIIKDDFIGEGWYNLSLLLNTPGKTENLYIDLIRKGKPAGRVLLEMTYNGPYQNQAPYTHQHHGWKQKANKFIKGYGTKYPPEYYNQQQAPFYNQTNQMPQGYQNPYNPGYGYQNYNQPGMQQQGQNKENIWNQPPTGGNYPGSQNMSPPQNYPNQPSWNPNQLGYNSNQPGWNPNQQQSSQSSGW